MESTRVGKQYLFDSKPKNKNPTLRHHFDCFWERRKKQLPEEAISGVEELKDKDQAKLRKAIAKVESNNTSV